MLKYLKIVAAAVANTTIDAVAGNVKDAAAKDEAMTDARALEVIPEADQTEKVAVANLDQDVRAISNRIAVPQTVLQDALVATLNQRNLVFQNQNVPDAKKRFC